MNTVGGCLPCTYVGHHQPTGTCPLVSLLVYSSILEGLTPALAGCGPSSYTIALMKPLACWEAVFLFQGAKVAAPIVSVIIGEVIGLGLARVAYLHGRHSASVVGAVLEGGSVVPGGGGYGGVEVGVADSALQHSAKSCTWGLAGYIIGGRPVLVGSSIIPLQYPT